VLLKQAAGSSECILVNLFCIVLYPTGRRVDLAVGEGKPIQKLAFLVE
jgi:hypothetical protein